MPPLTLDAARGILADNFAPWVLALGIGVEAVAPDGASLRIPFDARLCRVGGIVCGQALAAGADTAMVMALAAMAGALRPCTTVDLATTFLRPITDADVVLTARIMRAGRTLAFATCDIRAAGSDKPAAFATANYALLG